MKNIVIVSSTPRKNGNSEILAAEFKRGAGEKGHKVTEIFVRELDMKFCKGCLACQKTGKCVIKDDIAPLIDTVRSADVLVFASPVYYYSVCGQLKTFLDRMNPIYTLGHSFKEVYLISTAAENEESAVDGSISDIQGWIDCFSGVTLADVIKGIGATAPGEIRSHEDVMKQAYEMGCGV
ncbi:MAG: flavodoxin family protein [Acutalibacteraceae bacterium]